ncbi:MAG: cysteine peptidase family C39 domain-containing protein, partial [Luminiphilus sp.]
MGKTEDDVLLACLVIIARHHGLPATPESLSAGLPLDAEGLTPDLLKRSAQRAGLNSRMRKLAVTDIPETVCPAILLLEDGDACVYLGRTRSGGADVIYPRLVNSAVEETID